MLAAGCVKNRNGRRGQNSCWLTLFFLHYSCAYVLPFREEKHSERCLVADAAVDHQAVRQQVEIDEERPATMEYYAIYLPYKEPEMCKSPFPSLTSLYKVMVVLHYCYYYYLLLPSGD